MTVYFPKPVMLDEALLWLQARNIPYGDAVFTSVGLHRGIARMNVWLKKESDAQLH